MKSEIQYLIDLRVGVGHVWHLLTKELFVFGISFDESECFLSLGERGELRFPDQRT